MTASHRSGLLQSEGEWDARNRVLSETLTALVKDYVRPGAERALDIGCQTGVTTDRYAALTGLQWEGVDPVIEEPKSSPDGMSLFPGSSDRLDFPDGRFDVAMLANVYEHIFPERRVASFREIRRVLGPEGVVIGQIPNPYFPIESHSRLPFMGWLPTIRAQKVYWKLSPVSWEHDFFVVTPRHLRRDAAAGGLPVAMVRKFNYPPEVIPERLRGLARTLERPMRVMPWAWQFVLRPN
ncbi:MAG: class I SAM-dependent methyltransferase [Solirubrobacterales bacterium]